MPAQLPSGVTHIDCGTLDKPNAYVVDDGEVTLVDASWPGDESTVRNGLRAAGITPADIDRVLLTHYDADHVGTLVRLTPELDAPVHVHERDAPYVAGDRLPPWTARNGLEALHRLYYRRLSLPDLPVRTIEDGDDFGSFRAYHTPGHTPGDVAYVHAELSVAFLGDLAYGFGDVLKPTGGLTSYDADRITEHIQSLCRRAPDFEYACPGHGPPQSDGNTLLSAAVA